MYRVGFGQDSHKFSYDKSKPLVLGSVIIPNYPALEANSDGDVVLHAIFNAISQAIGGKSIGYYADTMVSEGITDSRKFSEVIIKELEEKGYQINNLGISIECQKPRIEPIHDEMKEKLANILGVAKDRIGITATSGEGLTAFGKGEGIQAFAIVSLVKKSSPGC